MANYIQQASDEELVQELRSRGYSVSRFHYKPMPESWAKRWRKNKTAIEEPLADQYALDRWVASCEGAQV